MATTTAAREGTPCHAKVKTAVDDTIGMLDRLCTVSGLYAGLRSHVGVGADRGCRARHCHSGSMQILHPLQARPMAPTT